MAGRRRNSHHQHSADQESFANRVSTVVRRLLVVIRRSIPDPRQAEHLRRADCRCCLRQVDYPRSADWQRCHRQVDFRHLHPGDRPAWASCPSRADCLRFGRHSVFERSKSMAATSTGYAKHSCAIRRHQAAPLRSAAHHRRVALLHQVAIRHQVAPHRHAHLHQPVPHRRLARLHRRHVLRPRRRGRRGPTCHSPARHTSQSRR